MILDSLSLDGKVAIITGASQGLGHAMALKFAEAGADIVAASRTKEKLEQTAEEVRKLGERLPHAKEGLAEVGSRILAMACALSG